MRGLKKIMHTLVNGCCPCVDASVSQLCDDASLGDMIRALSKASLWPLPERPYIGISFTNLEELLRDIGEGPMCVELQEREILEPSLATVTHRTNNEKIGSVLNEAESDLEGLALSEHDDSVRQP